MKVLNEKENLSYLLSDFAVEVSGFVLAGNKSSGNGNSQPGSGVLWTVVHTHTKLLIVVVCLAT